jgi:hypothetical protein
MSALGWMWLCRLFRIALTWQRSLGTRSQRRRRTIPSFEPLEGMALLSTGVHMMSGAAEHLARSSHHRLVRHVTTPHVLATDQMSSDQTPVTSPAQAVAIGNTPTDFTNEPLSPTLNLFNPSLGTLLSVTISHTATIQGNITSQNLSPSSATVITATFSGSYQIDGLNQPISQPTKTLTSAPTPAGPFGSGTDTVIFPPFVLADSSTTTFTDAASLAFFTSSTGRSSTTLTMTATASAAASAPNGNLLTTTQSSASSTVDVSYTYLPVCPTVSGIGRIGVHHQRTLLVVDFDGPVDPAKAEDPADYSVITPSGRTIPIKSATFDPATNAATVIPAVRLNVHHHFRLSVVLPCPNEQTGETVVIPFGGKRSLIGFHNHRGEFVTVQNGKITGFDNRDGQFVPVDHGKIERFKQRSSHDRIAEIRVRTHAKVATDLTTPERRPTVSRRGDRAQHRSSSGVRRLAGTKPRLESLQRLY